ncbi:GYD domain-containing protein [Chelatococcus sp. SYSU_G07232]|uniref:GYD domain-containing protein n=1 Tax=Chelatococcus albus TaxID=3047466 RepID=A0ABT7AJX9_9HYPH|nr:GYD domain-containing protein [Chelatococcus sp. SYSU_G07232]MDJ1159690.1 GYD domain-containing protein [Chelatococcus sp. SYSU_G07232]
MPTYCMLINFTDQGIRTIRDGGKRIDAGRELAKSLGLTLDKLDLCMGPYDVLVHMTAPNDEAVAKFVLALASRGNVRTTTMKTFSEQEYRKMLAELPPA